MMAQAKIAAGMTVALCSVLAATSAQAGFWGNSDAKGQADGKPLVQKVYDPESESYKDSGSSEESDNEYGSSSKGGYGSSYKPRRGYDEDNDRGGRYGQGYGQGSGYGYEPDYVRPYAVIKKLQNRGYYKIAFTDSTAPSYRLTACKDGINHSIRVNGWGNVVSSEEVGYCHRYHRFKDWWRSHRPW